MGLSLYSLGMPSSPLLRLQSLHVCLLSIGAIFFWPSAKFKAYGGFVGCTFVIGEIQSQLLAFLRFHMGWENVPSSFLISCRKHVV